MVPSLLLVERVGLELVVLANSLLEHTRDEEILDADGLVAVEVSKADTTILIVPIQHSRHPILILLMLLLVMRVLILELVLERSMELTILVRAAVRTSEMENKL